MTEIVFFFVMATNKYFKVSIRNAVKQINKVISLNQSLPVCEALHGEIESFGEPFILKSIRAGDYEVELATPVHVLSELG